jgi:biotin carboxylase
MSEKPIAVLYEHPEWFVSLFDELERRGVPHEKILIPDHLYDPAVRQSPYSVIVNRVSAYPSGGSHPEIVLYVQQYLAYLEGIGARVINGYESYRVGTSKALQLDLFERLGLRYPKARVVHSLEHAVAAAAGLTFPIVIKPNVGGSGTGILKLDSWEELELAIKARAVDLGIDHTGLVQEYLVAKDACIVRVEILGGEYLYAIRLPIAEHSFNYCPADGCNIDNPELAIESYIPPQAVIRQVQRILAASEADLGSVEYLVNQADGEVYYYDVNPLSNYVANAPRVVGFDPTKRLVEYILQRVGQI